MAPRNSSKSSTAKRNITVCLLCNFSGRKNNKLVICVSCMKKVHIHNCSATYESTNINRNDDNYDTFPDKQVVCSACKPGTTRARASLAENSNRLRRHSSAVQYSSRPSMRVVMPTATSVLRNGWTGGRAGD